MAITVPAIGDEISVATFGKPVADEVNRLTTEVNRMTPLVVAPTAWTNVVFQNSWTNSGSVQTCQYRKRNEMVDIRGRCTPGVLGATIYTLPAGFRPPLGFDFPAIYYDGARWNGCQGFANSDGTVICSATGTVGLVVLACSFSITA